VNIRTPELSLYKPRRQRSLDRLLLSITGGLILGLQFRSHSEKRGTGKPRDAQVKADDLAETSATYLGEQPLRTDHSYYQQLEDNN
jgi:hypothetical protein